MVNIYNLTVCRLDHHPQLGDGLVSLSAHQHTSLFIPANSNTSLVVVAAIFLGSEWLILGFYDNGQDPPLRG